MTTDEPDQPLDPISSEEETRVQRLLAEARATGPMPPDVSARMNDTVIGLAAERATEPTRTPGSLPPAGTVISLARARRHRAVALLGAAAAVVVIGVGVGSLIDREDEGSPDATSAESAVDRGDGGSVADEREAAEDGDDLTSDSAQSESRPDTAASQPGDQATLLTDQRPHRVRSNRLLADLVALQQATLPPAVAADYSRTTVTAPARFACKSANWGAGVLVAVQYDGVPALVAFREPVGETQVAEVLQCGTAEVLRSTTIPAAD